MVSTLIICNELFRLFLMASVGLKIFFMNSVGFLVGIHRNSCYWVGSKKINIYALSKCFSNMTDNFQFLNRQEMFSFSLEQRAKCNAQGAERKSTSMPYICQEVQDSFSKLLSNEGWKEICHFLHWAMISSHPDNRNGTDPFAFASCYL